ncbi:MAG: hypothetical protein ABFC63_07770 [Thermoguttaceae bacterium]
MPRPRVEQSEPVNGDSFLDIVASVVSIMIIMVVMEGMRIKNAPPKVAIAASPVSKELVQDLATEQSLRADVWKMTAETNRIKQQAAAQAYERNMLATVAVAAEEKIRELRDKLDRGKQASFDLTRGLSEARIELEQLASLRQRVENEPSQPIVVESYPTPISRAVDGPEAHLLISNGRVVFVPFEPLAERVKSQMRRQASQLANGDEVSDVVGPIGGFRLRYTLERRDMSPEMIRETGRGGSYVLVKRIEMIPESDTLGEPVRLALQESSDFRMALMKILPGRTTITIWVYPDGFEAFRQIRKELYRLGYSIAARPLPPGTPISGSPDGTKSAAQ